MTSPLDTVIRKDAAYRQALDLPCPDLLNPMPATAPDLFSSDYLSVAAEPTIRETFIRRLTKMPLVLGSTGSRLATGNTETHTAFEERMRTFFGSTAGHATEALLFNSGYDANVAFWSTIPQPDDIIVFDELVHASIRAGVAASRPKDQGALYPFRHNSPPAFRQCLLDVLHAHPDISEGKKTVFIAVETLYSMDGDFAPLHEIFDAVDKLLPPGCSHIMVDEAHTSGLFGPEGRGLLVELGLDGRANTVLHTFSKIWGMSGGMALSLPSSSPPKASRH